MVAMTGPEPTSRDAGGGRSLGPWRVPVLVLGWLVAAAVAMTIGTVAVSTVGATLRDRGPIGEEVPRQEARQETGEGRAVTLDRDAERVQRTVRDDFGEFDVVCQGLYAIGGETRPDRAAGWDVVSLEAGPDDDVDAVFARRGESIEVEVYCNRGVPTVADLERKRAPSS